MQKVNEMQEVNTRAMKAKEGKKKKSFGLRVSVKEDFYKKHKP